MNAICPGYIQTEMLDAVAPEVMAKSILIPSFPWAGWASPGI